MNEICFIYCHIPTRRAWPQNVELNPKGPQLGKMVLLFQCKVAWIPKTKENFVKACNHFGYRCGETFEWSPELYVF